MNNKTVYLGALHDIFIHPICGLGTVIGQTFVVIGQLGLIINKACVTFHTKTHPEGYTD